MSLSMMLDNLLAYSLQIAVLVSAGTVLVYAFRLKKPSLLLGFWQVLLLVCLMLPAVQPWKPLAEDLPQSWPAFVSSPASHAIPAGKPAPSPEPLPVAPAVAIVLSAGLATRLLRLLLGLFRLHALRLKGRPFVMDVLGPISAAVEPLGAPPSFLLSDEIDSPVTFGLGRPVVLLPNSFAAMAEAMQKPIACHELLHVRRRDWTFIVVEEFVLALFWFHPAVWWAVSRIRLSREQVVDREVLRITGERKSYLKTLLDIAARRSRPAALPAPLLLRERHLVERVALMLEEASMKRSRLIASTAGVVLLLICTGTLGAFWFPLQSGVSGRISQDPPLPQVREPIRVGGNVQEAKLIKRVDPVYPELAKEVKIQGIVILHVTVNEAGEVTDAKVLRGHPLLNASAVEAVKQWRYAPTLLNAVAVPVVATVTVQFRLGDSYRAILTAEGRLVGEDGLEGDALREKIAASEDGVLIQPANNIPFETLEGAVYALEQEGLRFSIAGPYLYREGRLFYRSGAPGVEPPVVAVDEERLNEMARAAKQAVDAKVWEARNGRARISMGFNYGLFIEPDGTIVGIRGQSLPSWLEMDETPLRAIEEEILRTARVVSPAYKEGAPVPFAYELSLRP